MFMGAKTKNFHFAFPRTRSGEKLKLLKFSGYPSYAKLILKKKRQNQFFVPTKICDAVWPSFMRHSYQLTVKIE